MPRSNGALEAQTYPPKKQIVNGIGEAICRTLFIYEAVIYIAPAITAAERASICSSNQTMLLPAPTFQL
jgi:hypothetical protein